MTNVLHEALDELVAAVPGHVVSDRLAEDAWKSGRRRRLRRRVGGVALAIGVAAMAGVLVPSLVNDLRSVSPSDHPNGARVQGYPQRIGHQWLVRDLPDRPGPVAGLMYAGAEASNWYVLSETGHRWRLPMDRRVVENYPTVSPDGRHLGYLVNAFGPYVIRDLVTGKRVEFPEIDGGWRVDKHFISSQEPTFWSADGTRLVMRADVGRTSDIRFPGAVVLDTSGSLQEVAPVSGALAGFSGSDQLVWVLWPKESTPNPPPSLTALVTTLDGTNVRTVPLRFSTPWEFDLPRQWSAVTSTNGQELLILEDLPGEARVRRFTLRDGSEVAPMVTVSTAPACGAGWAGSTPTVPVWNDQQSNAATAEIDDGTVRPIVVVEPGEGARCLIWASDALTGKAHGWFGLATGWWSWWWREILVVLLVVGALFAMLRAFSHRRTTRRASRPGAG